MKQREDWKWSWDSESEKKNENDDGVEMAEIVDEEIDPRESIPHKAQQQRTEQTHNRDCCSSTNNNSSCRMNIRNVYIGLALIGMGIVWLLNNLKMINWRTFDLLFSWQMLLVVLGGYFLVLRRWTLGVIFIAVGGLLVYQNWYGCNLSLAKIILPAALIAGGIAVALQRK